MDFHKQYRDMNENITPSDTLVQQTIAKMESGRPHRARKPLKIILAVASTRSPELKVTCACRPSSGTTRKSPTA